MEYYLKKKPTVTGASSNHSAIIKDLDGFLLAAAAPQLSESDVPRHQNGVMFYRSLAHEERTNTGFEGRRGRDVYNYLFDNADPCGFSFRSSLQDLRRYTSLLSFRASVGVR